MFIVFVYQSFSFGYIFGQVISGDDVFYVLYLRYQVTEVSKETVEIVGVVQASFFVGVFVFQFFLVVYNFCLFSIDLWGLFFVNVF